MKKTAFTLSALALAASSAQAYTFVDNETSGTKLEFLGSARIMWRSTSEKETYADGSQTQEHINHAIANNGSRFGFRITQQLGNGVYALGRVEWRFRGTGSSQHDFTDIYTRQLYAGIGHKQYGELTYGHQTVITDEVKQTDLPNTLSLSDGLLNSAARKSVQYVYKGIDGLKVGVYYGGSSKRGNTGLDLSNKRKDTWGAGAIYKYKIDDAQSITFGAGVTNETSERSGGNYDATAYSFGTAYTLNKTTLGLDLERKQTDDRYNSGDKRVQKEIRTVLYQKLTDDWSAYTMYAYKTDKADFTSAARSNTESKTHQYMVGTEYYLVPKSNPLYVKTFLEWQTSRAKNYTNGEKTSKTRDNQTVIGLRAYW
ncbi:porin [Glaesserella sp.]|uniref:porin n=1 Tax=Glaesserella sp. TaxID=2094731 RepID=UPI00359F18EB